MRVLEDRNRLQSGSADDERKRVQGIVECWIQIETDLEAKVVSSREIEKILSIDYLWRDRTREIKILSGTLTSKYVKEDQVMIGIPVDYPDWAPGSYVFRDVVERVSLRVAGVSRVIGCSQVIAEALAVVPLLNHISQVNEALAEILSRIQALEHQGDQQSKISSDHGSRLDAQRDGLDSTGDHLAKIYKQIDHLTVVDRELEAGLSEIWKVLGQKGLA